MNFSELIKSKQIKFQVVPHATFSSDKHAENFFRYLFNTSKKNINDRSKINVYYQPKGEIYLQKEALQNKLDKDSLKNVLSLGYANVENMIVYNNILEYCMLNHINNKAEILQVLKDFADFASYVLSLDTLICGYHFNQEEPHLHLVYKAKNNKEIDSNNKDNEDEDF